MVLRRAPCPRGLEQGRRDPESRYGAFASRLDEFHDRRLHLDAHAAQVGTVDELQLIVWQAARAGSVQAMRLCPTRSAPGAFALRGASD